jgi:hypothetical protein
MAINMYMWIIRGYVQGGIMNGAKALDTSTDAWTSQCNRFESFPAYMVAPLLHCTDDDIEIRVHHSENCGALRLLTRLDNEEYFAIGAIVVA